ncbi:MAG: hypothetical protein GXC94_05985 [Comamonadaceae bacterium]|jgi:protein TonB|nr:hypothetical protein [Comamonadaceae bacterium]
MKPSLAALAAWSLMMSFGPALAQPAPAAAPVCQVAPPQAPPVEWRGIAAYRAKAKVQGGRVVSVDVSPLKGGVERRAQRALVMAIVQALQNAPCQPGEHEFQQDFAFDLTQPAAPASGAARG